MKQKVLCVINASVAALLILVIINCTLFNGLEEKAVPASIQTNSYSEEVVQEYIYENYVISEKNPWTDYGLHSVDYQISGSVEDFGGSIECEAAVLVDVNNQKILYEKNSEIQLCPASTTKLMTALTVLQILNEKDVVTVGAEIDMIAADSSVAGFSKGQVVTVKELLEGLLVSSGNDAAYILAKAAGEALFKNNIAYEGRTFNETQCVERFVLEMNKNVREMELENTNFTTPDGYDSRDQYTSAIDLAKIATEAYDNKTIREICGMKDVHSKTLDKTWISTNKLMDNESPFYYKYCVGMKTGTTDLAGNCLVSVALRDERVYISVVLNGEDDQDRWDDSKELLQYALE